nr:galactokinase [Vagococcus vulneris]
MENLTKEFIKVFEETSENTFFAPGRINLIGEHIDYNGGHVFPCAISYGTYGLTRKRSDRIVRLYSMNFSDQGIKEFSLDNLVFKESDDWANYPKGMISYLYDLDSSQATGFDMLIYGNIPNGAGLSSSASIELLTAVAIEKMWQIKPDRINLVKLGQKVENDFIGVNSGIMDQFAVGMGQSNHALLLDCDTLEYSVVPLELPHEKILIMNTNKRRELADSKYNARRSECNEALRELQKVIKIDTLSDLSVTDFEKYQGSLSRDILRQRVRHVVTENQRTLDAKEALEAGDLVVFGQLMNESHQSLKADYEVTGNELDTIVELVQNQEGVIGARMTGAGFGGCAIALVEDDSLDRVIDQVGQAYADKIGYEADFYIASVGDGAKEII